MRGGNPQDFSSNDKSKSTQKYKSNMQFISNIIFWLQAALAASVTACFVAVILFIVCVAGIGWGIGRLWHAKWKIGFSGLIVSLVFGFLVSTLGIVYVAMGFIKDTMISASARVQLKNELTRVMNDNKKLPDLAFTSGLKTLVASGIGADSIDPESTTIFQFPGDPGTEMEANQGLFVSGAIKAIAQGDTSKKGKKTRTTALKDLAPFCYGTKPVSSDTDGFIYAKFQDDLSGHEGQGLSREEDTWWYTSLCKAVIEESLKKFENGICQDLDSQQTNVLLLIIMMILIQAGLISWLAIADIQPRRTH